MWELTISYLDTGRIEKSSNILLDPVHVNFCRDYLDNILIQSEIKREMIRSLVLPYGVKSIDADTFRGCIRLISIDIPESITSIGERAFYECSQLTLMSLPKSLSSIGQAAFFTCVRLESINIPEAITSIESCTFRNRYTMFNRHNLRMVVASAALDSSIREQLGDQCLLISYSNYRALRLSKVVLEEQEILCKLFILRDAQLIIQTIEKILQNKSPEFQTILLDKIGKTSDLGGSIILNTPFETALELRKVSREVSFKNNERWSIFHHQRRDGSTQELDLTTSLTQTLNIDSGLH